MRVPLRLWFVFGAYLVCLATPILLPEFHFALIERHVSLRGCAISTRPVCVFRILVTHKRVACARMYALHDCFRYSRVCVCVRIDTVRPRCSVSPVVPGPVQLAWLYIITFLRNRIASPRGVNAVVSDDDFSVINFDGLLNCWRRAYLDMRCVTDAHARVHTRAVSCSARAADRTSFAEVLHICVEVTIQMLGFQRTVT